MELKPRDYQIKGIQFMANRRRVINADDMGLGKTIQTILAIRQLKSRSNLIVCSKSLTHNWKKEINLWFPYAPVTIVEGTKKQREAIVNNYREGFLICNYEFLRAEKIEKSEGKSRVTFQKSNVLEIMFNKNFNTLVVDEAHRCKNIKAQRTKGIQWLTKKCENLFLLTGTPVQNTGDEIWTLLNFIDPKKYGSFYKFIEKHFQGEWNGYSYEINDSPTYPEAFKAELKPFFIRRLKEDVLTELPEKVYSRIELELEGKQKQIYLQMEEEMFAEIEQDKFIVAPVAIAKMIRLKQFCIHPEIATEQDYSNFSLSQCENPKFENLIDLLEDTNEKFLVFSTYNRALNLLAQYLKLKKVSFIKYEGDFKQVEQFNSKNDIRCFLTTIKKGGEGLNLTSAPYVYFLDKDWTPAINEQAVARSHRMGQTKGVVVYETFIKNSIEEYIEDINIHKTNVMKAIMELKEKRYKNV